MAGRRSGRWDCSKLATLCCTVLSRSDSRPDCALVLAPVWLCPKARADSAAETICFRVMRELRRSERCSPSCPARWRESTSSVLLVDAECSLPALLGWPCAS